MDSDPDRADVVGFASASTTTVAVPVPCPGARTRAHGTAVDEVQAQVGALALMETFAVPPEAPNWAMLAGETVKVHGAGGGGRMSAPSPGWAAMAARSLSRLRRPISASAVKPRLASSSMCPPTCVAALGTRVAS